LVDALYVATDVGTRKLLRRDLGLSRTRASAVVESLARGALAEAGKQGEGVRVLMATWGVGGHVPVEIARKGHPS
jgi:hypothetical protein